MMYMMEYEIDFWGPRYVRWNWEVSLGTPNASEMVTPSVAVEGH